MTRPFLIIVEGADCSGKSTLSRFLAKELGAAYFHATGDKRIYQTMGAMTAYHKSILDNARINLLNQVSVVLDRSWPSEICYGPVMRPDIHEKEKFPAKDFMKQCQDMGALYIYCECEGQLQHQLAHPDPTHPYNSHQYTHILGHYQKWADALIEQDLPLMIYDMQVEGMDMFKKLEAIRAL